MNLIFVPLMPPRSLTIAKYAASARATAPYSLAQPVAQVMLPILISFEHKEAG
jgi:hypothetical protein